MGFLASIGYYGSLTMFNAMLLGMMAKSTSLQAASIAGASQRGCRMMVSVAHNKRAKKYQYLQIKYEKGRYQCQNSISLCQNSTCFLTLSDTILTYFGVKKAK